MKPVSETKTCRLTLLDETLQESVIQERKILCLLRSVLQDRLNTINSRIEAIDEQNGDKI